MSGEITPKVLSTSKAMIASFETMSVTETVAQQSSVHLNRIMCRWLGTNASVYGNQVYMDTATNALGKKMYFLNAWDCSATVWDNFMAYDGELFSVDHEDDHWKLLQLQPAHLRKQLK